MLASDWQNPGQVSDVNNDLAVSPLDALIGINRLNELGSTTLPIRDANSQEAFFDVNGDGTHSPLDVLIPINVLNARAPVIAARLSNDTSPSGTTNQDRVTSDPSIMARVSVASANQVFAGIGSDVEPSIDISALLIGDTLSLDESDIDTLFGTKLPDGDHVLRLLVSGNDMQSDPVSLPFTVDRIAPTATVTIDEVVRSSFDRFSVLFDEPVVGTAFDPASFDLTVADGENAGEKVTVDRVGSGAAGAEAIVTFPQRLADRAYRLTFPGVFHDVAGNSAERLGALDFVVADPTGIRELSPNSGEKMVRLTRETVVRFDERVDPTTVTSDSIQVIAAGNQVAGRLVVSSTERFATFFYNDPLPASTKVRVIVDGETIMGRDGLPLDADGDNQPGGRRQYEFDTVPNTRIPGTSVSGFVFDSHRTDDGGADVPIIGATLRVEGSPEIVAVTDENGRFVLTDVPAPEFFVVIDGTTAQAPEGFHYPAVAKPFHSIPGHAVQLNKNGMPFDIFLPPIADADAVQVVADEQTLVQFSELSLDALAEIAPDVPRDMWRDLRVDIPANSLFFDDQSPATQVSVFPLDPERIPVPLPDGAIPKIVWSVEANGATNFDEAASVVYPNVDGLAPGERRFIYSFDHDAGVWRPTGTMIVSEDGKTMVSDDGVQTLGWRYVAAMPETVLDFCVFSCEDDDDQEMPDESVTFEAGVRLFGSLPGVTFDPQWEARFHDQQIDLLQLLFGFSEIPILEPVQDSVEYSYSFQASGLWAEILDSLTFNVTEQTTVTLVLAVGTVHQAGIEYKASTNCLEILPRLARVNDFGGLVRAESNSSFLDLLRSLGSPFPHAITIPFNKSGFNLAGTGVTLCDGPQLPANEAFVVRNATQATLRLGPLEWGLNIYLRRLAGPSRQAANRTLGTEQASQLSAKTDPASNSAAPSYSSSNGFGDALPTYVRIELENGTELRLRGAEIGQTTAILPANSRFTLVAYDPSTNSYAIRLGETGTSGTVSSLQVGTTGLGGPDTDADGLPDIGELAIGTDPQSADTDNDGILDADEIAQGLDPLDDRGFPTGIIATVPVLGAAQEVVVVSDVDRTQTAFLATGNNGLAIVDVATIAQPVLRSEITLSGFAFDVAVDLMRDHAVVAAGASGLHIVDVADLDNPQLIQTISNLGTVRRVEIVDGQVYAVSDRLAIVDPATGEIQQRIDLGSGLEDISSEGDFLYAVTSDHRLHVLDLSLPQVVRRGIIELPGRFQNGQVRLSVGNDVAYVANGIENQLIQIPDPQLRGGYLTVDVSNPDTPLVLSGSDTPEVQAGNFKTVSNGSGLAIVAAGSRGLEIHNARDPETTYDFQTRIDTPGTALSVVTSGGIAYVADGTAGLQVINYLPFDRNRQAPTVVVTPRIPDADPSEDGHQVPEGSSIPLNVQINDDVQVREAELIVNGSIVQRRTSFPFEFSAIALGNLADDPTTTIEVRATDTGGNVTVSEPFVLFLVPDTFDPAIVQTSPSDGSIRSRNARTIRVSFSESMDVATLIPENFTLTGPAGTELIPTDVRIFADDRAVQLTYESFAIGEYQLAIDASGLADRAGNRLGTEVVTSSFTVVDASAVWINEAGGLWTDAENWDTGVVPGIDDDVVIDLPQDVTVEHANGNIEVGSLIVGDRLSILGGSLRVDRDATIDGTLTMLGGSLTIQGVDSSLTVNGAASFDTATLTLTEGMFDFGSTTDFTNSSLILHGATQPNMPNLTNIDDSRFRLSGGAQLTLPATTYTLRRFSRDRVFSADGENTRLDISKLESIDARWDDGTRFGRNTQEIAATGGGEIDLSGLVSITGAARVEDGQRLLIGAGSRIILDSLRETIGDAGYVEFDVHAQGFELPSLVDAQQLSVIANGGGSVSLPQVTQLNGASIRTEPSSTVSIPQLTSFTAGRLELRADQTFISPPLSIIDNSQFVISGGTQFSVAAASYSSTARPATTIFSATGQGTHLDLSSLQQFDAGWDDGTRIGANVQTIEALGGASIDLSGITSLTPPVRVEDGERFVVGSGSNIDLRNLSGFPSDGGFVELRIETPYGLPALQAGAALRLDVRDAGRLELPLVTSLDRSHIALSGGGAVDIPNLTAFTFSDLTISGSTSNFNAFPVDIDNSTIQLSSGASYRVVANSYSSVNRFTRRVFSADGEDSFLDASALTTFDGRWDDGTRIGANRQAIQALNGGHVDLSALVTATAPLRFEDGLEFIVGTDSRIDLDSLESLVSDAGFIDLQVNAATFSLPKLISAGALALNVGVDANLTIAGLQALSRSTIAIGDGGTLNAPALNEFTNGTISLGANQSLITGGLANIDESRFFLRDGAQLTVSATRYTNHTLVQGPIFEAIGDGTILNLSSLTSLDSAVDLGGIAFNRTISIVARDGARISLLGLGTLAGRTGGDDLRVLNENGGLVELDDPELLNNVTITSN